MAASARPFDPADELQLQISFLCCKALQEPTPLEFLTQNLSYHNGGRVQVHEVGLAKYLVLETDGTVQPVPSCKLAYQLEPTIYLAFASHKDATYGNFFCGSCPCEFELSPEATIQANVMSVLEDFPVASLFNLLGQGYRVVLSGHLFGGVLAHALASKLLLQLRQEILLAESMGFNLEALSATVNK
eukprot:gene31854-7060_t